MSDERAARRHGARRARGANVAAAAAAAARATSARGTATSATAMGARAATRVVLQRYGYRVLEADSAAAALTRWDAEGGRVDLLLTDLVMGGGISGRQLAETLRGRSPALKVVYMSGYNRDFLARVLQLEPGQPVIPKPCTAAELAATVRRCLDVAAAPPSPRERC